MDWIKTKSGHIASAGGNHWTVKRDRIRGWSLFVRRIPGATFRVTSTPWLHVAMGIAERESA